MAQAADLTINGYSFSSSNSDISAGQTKGKISYSTNSSGGGTLTFDGVTISSTKKIIYWTGSGTLTVLFKGINSLTCSENYTICSQDADLNLKGEMGVCATVTIESKGDNFSAVSVKGGHTVSFSHLFLTVKGTYWGITGDNSNISNSKASFVAVRGTVSTPSTTDGAICRFGSVYFDSRDAYLETGSYNSSKHAVCDSNGNPLKTVSIMSPFTVGDAIVGIGYSGSISISPSGLKSGTITYNHDSRTLKLSNVDLEAGDVYNGNIYRAIQLLKNNAITDLTIEVEGSSNKIKRTIDSYGTCIHCEGNLTIKGTSYNESLLAVDGWWGISTQKGGNQTYKNVYINGLSCKEKGLVGDDSKSTITFDNCVAWVKTSDSAAKTISGFVSCEYLNGTGVMTSLYPGVCYRSSLKGFGTATELTKTGVAISIASDTYPIKVLGTQVTDLNNTDVQVDGLTAGKISYDKSSATLTLNGVELTNPSTNTSDAIVLTSSSAITINQTGENKITAKGRGIYFAANTTISGTGNVIFTSTAGSGGAAQTGKNLTLNTNGRVSFFGETYGLWVGSGLTMKKTNANTHFRFKGNSNASLYVAGSLSLDGVALWSGWSADADAMYGCYFKDQYVYQNGGAVAKGLVAYKFVEKKYDLYVAGTQVTDCNAPGFGSKYITSGGAKAVTYDAEKKTLTLNSATINNGGASVNCIKNEAVNGLIVQVIGNSTLTSSSSNSALFISGTSAPTTINGGAKLTINGSTSNSVVAWSNLTLDNIEMEVAHNLFGSTGYPKLTVKITTSGRRVTVNGNVDGWEDVLVSGGTKIINPDPWKINDHAVWNTNLNVKASPVVFGDPSATGIEGIVADPNAEVIGIFDAQGRQLDEMQPGVNILRMSDGTTRKVMRK